VSEPAGGLPIELVDVVLKNLADRSGFDHWWDDLDVDVQLDIINSLEAALAARLRERGVE
jgi:hypothetical protein